MTLKNKIHAEYISAFKNRETVKKNLLGVLRGEITTIEKNTGTADLSDAEITKLLLKYKKNTQDSRALSDTPELAEEAAIIESFLPKQMSREEVHAHVAKIMESLPPGLPVNARIGKTMGEFNKMYAGRAESAVVMEVINSIGA